MNKYEITYEVKLKIDVEAYDEHDALQKADAKIESYNSKDVMVIGYMEISIPKESTAVAQLTEVSTTGRNM